MNFGGTLRINKFACFTLAFIMFLIIYWKFGGTGYPSDKSDLINLKHLLKASIRVAELGGKKINEAKSHELKIKSKGKTKEGANNPVTNADYASHCVMYYSLKNTFPKVNIVSEEYPKPDLECIHQPPLDLEVLPSDLSIENLFDELVFTKDVAIWIDPLDATQEFTESLYEYVTTMVCVAIRGIPIIGVIHYPFSPYTYWGWYTKKNNIPVMKHKIENRNTPRVVISRSHPGKVTEVAKEAFGHNAIISKAGGSGYKVIAVANGTYDMYLHTTAIQKWDICAGEAIIKSIDGKMTTAKGEVIDFSIDSPVTVKNGLLVTHYDHDYYLSKMLKVISSLP